MRILLLALALLAGCGRQGEQYHIYSLHPRSDALTKRDMAMDLNAYSLWRGRLVIDHAAVADPQLQSRILAAIDNSLAQQNTVTSGPFQPRYGIQIGADAYLLCFESHICQVNERLRAIDTDGEAELQAIWNLFQLARID